MKKKTIAMTELKMARINAGLTQAEVGEALGMDKNTVCNHETGRALVNIRQIILYAKLYKVDDYRDLCPNPSRIHKSMV